jgi:hypothetical protein
MLDEESYEIWYSGTAGGSYFLRWLAPEHVQDKCAGILCGPFDNLDAAITFGAMLYNECTWMS